MTPIVEDLSIGDVAEATGLSEHALRFFEREGLLLREIPRSAGKRRIYAPADVAWLLLCNRFRASGMPLATIRRFAGLVRAGPGNETERLAILQQHERDVRARMAALGDDLAIISAKVATYEQHVRDETTAGVWDPSDPTTHAGPASR